MTAVVDNKRPYVNEQVVLHVKFHTAVPLMGNAEWGPPNTAGFLKEDLPPGKPSEITKNGRVYYITEVNPLRIGSYLPGVHIPIVDERWMFEDPEPPDAGVLFSWNYYDEIVPKLRERGFEGEVILP